MAWLGHAFSRFSKLQKRGNVLKKAKHNAEDGTDVDDGGGPSGLCGEEAQLEWTSGRVRLGWRSTRLEARQESHDARAGIDNFPLLESPRLSVVATRQLDTTQLRIRTLRSLFWKDWPFYASVTALVSGLWSAFVAAFHPQHLPLAAASRYQTPQAKRHSHRPAGQRMSLLRADGPLSLANSNLRDRSRVSNSLRPPLHPRALVRPTACLSVRQPQPV